MIVLREPCIIYDNLICQKIYGNALRADFILISAVLPYFAYMDLCFL